MTRIMLSVSWLLTVLYSLGQKLWIVEKDNDKDNNNKNNLKIISQIVVDCRGFCKIMRIQSAQVQVSKYK